MQPEHLIEAEQILLHNIINGRGDHFMDEVYPHIGDDIVAFTQESHQAIYSAVLDVQKAEESINPISVCSRLEKLGQRDITGGSATLSNLSATYSADLSYYAKIVAGTGYRKRLQRLSSNIEQKSRSEEKPEEITAWLNAEIYGLVGSSEEARIISVAEVADAAAQAIIDRGKKGGITGVRSGFSDLDLKTGGFQNTDLVIIAARPSVGKSAWMLNSAFNAAKDGKRVLIFSLEMDATQLTQRLLTICGQLNTEALYDWEHRAPDEEQKLSDAVIAVKELPIFICDAPNCPLYELKAKALRHASTHGCDIVMVDYLQLIKPGTKRDVREQEVAEISREMKALARELDKPVVVLAQLNRAVETRSNPEPMLADLRESGSIEQDADQVIMLWRKERENNNLIGCKLAKQRKGPIGWMDLNFNTTTQRFNAIDNRSEH